MTEEELEGVWIVDRRVRPALLRLTGISRDTVKKWERKMWTNI